MIFIRITKSLPFGVEAKVYGSYPDADAAESDLIRWAESHDIRLCKGLPFPNYDYWANGGELLFSIEPGQGNPGRKLSEST